MLLRHSLPQQLLLWQLLSSSCAGCQCLRGAAPGLAVCSVFQQEFQGFAGVTVAPEAVSSGKVRVTPMWKGAIFAGKLLSRASKVPAVMRNRHGQRCREN